MMTLGRILISLMILQAVPQGGLSEYASGQKTHKSPGIPRSKVPNSSRAIRELIQTANSGDTRKVLTLLDKGLDVNSTFDRDESELSGMTALMVASSRGDAEMIEALIERRANVNLKRWTGETALMLAADSGSVRAIKALLAARADPDASVMSPHAGELTPLTRAMNSDSENKLEVAQTLIAAGATINPKGIFFMSPLMNAVDNLDMVKLLIANGAEVNQRNFRGATALMGAAASGSVSIVKYLLEKGADVNARDKDGTTALMAAEDIKSPFRTSERDEIIQLLRRFRTKSKP
jgi:uncharacterized protein